MLLLYEILANTLPPELSMLVYDDKRHSKAMPLNGEVRETYCLDLFWYLSGN